MPRVSDRRQLIADLISGMTAAALDVEDYEDFVLLDTLFDTDGELSLDSIFEMDEELLLDTPMDDLAEVLMLVEGNRYLTPRLLYDKSSDFTKNYSCSCPTTAFAS